MSPRIRIIENSKKPAMSILQQWQEARVATAFSL
jgi:hypothetical protein